MGTTAPNEMVFRRGNSARDEIVNSNWTMPMMVESREILAVILACMDRNAQNSLRERLNRYFYRRMGKLYIVPILKGTSDTFAV